MKILTPFESIMNKIEGKISKEEFFILQKEILNSYASGFYDAHKKPTTLKIKNSILSSNIWRSLNNNDLLKIWS